MDATADETEASDVTEVLASEDWRALNGIPCIVGGIKALVASLGGTLHARTTDHFPWKTMPGELELLGYVLVNYPEGVLMPGEARHPYARVKGVRDLVAGQRNSLVYALKSGTLTIRAITDGAGRARLTKCEDPVVVGAAPPARSMHSHGRRMFADGRVDRDGLPRLPPGSPRLLPRPSHLPPVHIRDDDEDEAEESEDEYPNRGQDEDENEDEDQNRDEGESDDEDNGKGKTRASVESVRSRNDDISTDNLRPTKRPRLEEAAPAAHRHEQFWISDGNTVLEVGGVAFKLHRSRLVDQSTFFAGLLGEQDVQMDGGVVENDENGAVYHLSNTTPEDFEALLHFDRNPMTYYLTLPLFPVLAAIVRAATTLGFDTHRAFAVKLLENTWSSALADLTTDIQPYAVEAAILARSCGIKSILKRAFYEMVRVAGYGLSDGELADGDGKKDQEISRADERRLERMRESLISTWLEVATRVDRSVVCPHEPKATFGGPASTEPSSSTTRSFKCPSLSSKREAWERRVHDSGLHSQYLLDPLCGLQALIDIKWEEDEGWCSGCVRARREVWTRVRQQTWQRVGVWMGLEA